VLSVFSPHSCRHPRPTLFPYTTLFRSRDEHAAREAALARAAVERFGDHADGAIEIGIGHDDDEVLRAAERLDTFTGVRCALVDRSEEHTSELQSRFDLVCRLLLEKKKQ